MPTSKPNSYGVLVGTIEDGREAKTADPHFMILVEAAGVSYRIAVNIRSSDGSELLVLLDPGYADATKRDLPSLAGGPPGFTPLATGPGGAGLDYLRDGLFPLSRMVPLPADGSVSLDADFAALVARAKADPDAVAIMFGERFEDRGSDETFGFSPERGVHDIHMMQGDPGRYASEDRSNGDGALFVRFSDGTTTAFFARFRTQSIEIPPG